MQRSARSRTLVSWLPLVSLGFLVLACAVGGRRAATVAPQEWWKERGPVVPHDTFPSDCSLCHKSGSWHEIRDDFVFDHALETGVPLEGAHERAECLRCHNDRGAVADFARQGCVGCHEDVHRGRLGRNCVDCHDQSLWTPKRQIDQHARTRFPLVGAHAATACFRCHPGYEVGNFDRTPIACVECHRDDLARATTPDHMALGFTDDCQRCHIPTSWTGSAFNHGFFPLTGRHAPLACQECHVGGNFVGTPTNCVDCHLADYTATTDPDHGSAGFSTSCELCHTTGGWEGAFFNHSTWPLTGAHLAQACDACHVGGVYAGTPRNCVDCHLSEYTATTSPNHTSAGFPTSCEACHNTTTWDGAVFNHTFPIAGPHNQSCTECHQTPGNYASFSCTHCHEHRQSQADNDHDEVNGYSWTSAACFMCHPDGDN